jgi:hypothetical protein
VLDKIQGAIETTIELACYLCISKIYAGLFEPLLPWKEVVIGDPSQKRASSGNGDHFTNGNDKIMVGCILEKDHDRRNGDLQYADPSAGWPSGQLKSKPHNIVVSVPITS